jgi:adenosylmethionine-8-amino-7-oxononanoate aminotransferase
MGATLTTDKVAHGISNEGGPFMHGPTFMGNPLACSVSLASLKLIQNSPWKKRVNHVRNQLINHLSPLASVLSVREVRVLGAIGVCELKESLTRDDMARVQRLLVDNGVWLRPFGKLLYTMPPFNSDALKDEHVQKIGEAMYNVALTL